MTLLIATQNPNATAETYVRQHMRRIAPGRTVGLALSSRGIAYGDIPFLASPPQRFGPMRTANLLIGRLFCGFAGAPAGRQRRDIITFMRSHGVTVVLAEFGPTGAALRDITQSEGIPLVVHFHGFDGTVMPRRTSVRSAYRLLARDADGFICGSQSFSRTLTEIGFPKSKIEVIPYGVETGNFFASPSRTGRKLIAVGRLVAKKAPLNTLAAFARALRVVPDLTIEMIGDGPLRRDCEIYIAENGLYGKAIMRGALDHHEVCVALSAADIFVQHSIVAPNGDTESLGISLIEAMASSLPVVASDHECFRETVEPGKTGFLTPEGDIDGMAHRIVELAQDRSLQLAMGEAGLLRARESFDERDSSRKLQCYLGKFAEF